ncbi:MAG: FtsB family cell division protein [Opitutales bacterium]
MFLILLVVALSAVTTGLILVWTQTRREYIAFEDRRAQAEIQLADLRKERESKEAYLKAFINDPEFVERVIRDRMGYVGPGEIVFRFQNP